jgi:hypothetical protein
MAIQTRQFLVQRAANCPNPEWRTTARFTKEDEARVELQRIRRLYTSGQFRIVNPDGETIVQEKAMPLFERSERDEVQRESMCYDPTKFKPTSA